MKRDQEIAMWTKDKSKLDTHAYVKASLANDKQKELNARNLVYTNPDMINFSSARRVMNEKDLKKFQWQRRRAFTETANNYAPELDSTDLDKLLDLSDPNKPKFKIALTTAQQRHVIDEYNKHSVDFKKSKVEFEEHYKHNGKDEIYKHPHNIDYKRVLTLKTPSHKAIEENRNKVDFPAWYHSVTVHNKKRSHWTNSGGISENNIDAEIIYLRKLSKIQGLNELMKSDYRIQQYGTKPVFGNLASHLADNLEKYKNRK